MRRCAVFERIQEEAEARACRLARHAERLEDQVLHIAAMNTDRAAADLAPVDDRIVSLRAKLTEERGLALFDRTTQERQIFIQRRGERVMHGIIRSEEQTSE